MQLIVRTTAGRVNNLRIGPSRGPQGPTGPQGQVGATGPQGDPATNLVQSVNGKQGVVVLNATDVNADPTGSASQALQDAKDYTDSEVSTLDSSLAPVAKTGSYDDLSNKPNIPSIAGLATEQYVDNGLATKVDKEVGKGLSANDYTTLEKNKLAGIANNATANQTDSYLLNRTNHTGTQAQSTITNLTTDLAAKANASDTVNLTGDQTVAGVKTFSSSPVVPTATTNTQAVNKAQMDTADALKVNKAGDTMTGALTVDGGLSPIVIRGNGASTFLNVTMANDNANTGTQNINERRLVKNSSGTLRPALEQFSYLTTPTAGAERSTVRYFTFSGGAQTKVMELNGPDVLVENQLSVGGARYISGTGFPNGVVSAPVGSTYKNLDRGASWTGDIEWVKASGTGNTGWVVSVGDTGWRNVTADFSAALTVVNPNDYGCYIRRINSTVQISIKAQSVYSSWTGQTASLYVGFRLDNSSGTPAVINEALQVAGPGRGQVQVGINMVFVSATGITTGTRFYFSVSGGARTSEPWPSTLPGVSV